MSFSFLRRLRHAFAQTPTEEPTVSRRGFMAGVGGLALGSSLLLPDDAWASVQARAARFGIVPGTLVDAQGRTMARSAFGSEPFIAEITLFAGNFAPVGYQLCQGQLLSISQNQALFSILGTTYGGNGMTTFALPDLRGRFPMQQGQGLGLSNRSLGEQGGAESVTLLQSEMPAHTHALTEVQVRGTGTQAVGLATGGTRSTAMTSVTGSSMPHNNMSPYLALNFIIATQGIFPTHP